MSKLPPLNLISLPTTAALCYWHAPQKTKYIRSTATVLLKIMLFVHDCARNFLWVELHGSYTAQNISVYMQAHWQGLSTKLTLAECDVLFKEAVSCET